MEQKPPTNLESGQRDNSALTLHYRQWDIVNCPARFRVVVAGRRFGKTELALAEITMAAKQKNQNIWYVGPNKEQTKRMVWDRVKAATEPFWARKPLESTNRIDLQNGTKILVNGALKGDSLRGDGLDLLVLDEFASMAATIWRRVFRPMLADRKGRALFMGTPMGRNHFFDAYEKGQLEASPEWKSFQFTTADGGIVEADELASAAEDLDADSYRQEFGAEFGTFGKHRVYAAFERDVHVMPLLFDPTEPLIWTMDFNVDPMCMLLMQLTPEKHIHVLDEMVVRPNATTELACQAFLAKAKPLSDRLSYIHRPLVVNIYGDSSGNQRTTAAAGSDWGIVKEFFRMWVGDFKPHHHIPAANPLVRERVNAVRARLRNQAGEVRLFIDPKCKELIRDFEEVSWVTDSAGVATGEIDKKDRRRTHASDALGYYVHRVFPISGGSVGYRDKPLPNF